MRLIAAQQMARVLMNYHGVAHEYKFQWMQMRKHFNRAGQCNYDKKVIFLQPRFVLCNPPFIVKRTLIHEIAHALCPYQGHNVQWVRMAKKLGHPGARCYGDEVRKKLPRRK